MDNSSISQFNRNDYLIKSNRKTSINHNKFSQFIMKHHQLLSANGNIFQYNTKGDNVGLRTSLNKREVEKLVINYIQNFLKFKVIKNNDVTNIIKFMQAHAESKQLRDKLSTKDQNEYLVFLNKSVLDTRTRESRDYKYEDFAFTKLPYGFDQINLKDNPKLRLHFLEQILGGWKNKEKIISFLQEYIGRLLIPSSKYEKSVLLYGSGGNGKGTLVETIKHVIGEHNTVSLGLHELNKDQNIYLIFGKLLCLDTDINDGVQLDSGIIKKIVSGETVIAKEVYKKPMNFKPYARLIFCANSMPYLANIDNSITRRFVFLHLKNSFNDKPDPNLKENLRNEAPLIFSRALQGLKRLQERGRFDIPEELSEYTKNHIKEADSVEMFVQYGGLEVNPNYYIPYSNLHHCYQSFCKDNGYKGVGSRKLIDRLVAKGFEKHRTARDRGLRGLGGDPFDVTINPRAGP